MAAAVLSLAAKMEDCTATAEAEDRAVCLGCKTRFASRSAVFRHLKATGCGGAVPERVEKVVVVYAYDGRAFHGSQSNGAAAEARCPTADTARATTHRCTRAPRGRPSTAHLAATPGGAGTAMRSRWAAAALVSISGS